MDHHKQIHNDIKPHNYLVKNENDLSRIEIVLTDFGLAGSDSKGGTPIFASPECFADADRKDKSDKSDIFSLGRVFLFVILKQDEFLEFLFISLAKGEKEKITKLIENEPFLNLASKMMRIKKRIDLQRIQKELRSLLQIRNAGTITKIGDTVEKSTSEYTTDYINILKHFSKVIILSYLIFHFHS